MKTFSGQVISKKMDKTATVIVDRVVAHPVYRKRYRVVKKYHVHDPFGVDVGQTVEFVSSKPYSKLKKWIITEVVGDNEDEDVSKEKSKKSKTSKKGKEKSA